MESSALVNRRTRYLLVLYALAVLWGVRKGLLPRAYQNSDFVLTFVAGIVSVLLISTDAQLRGRPFPGEARWLMTFVWPVALPIYAVATRGLRGFWVAFKHLALAYAGLIAAGFIARFVASHLAPSYRLPY